MIFLQILFRFINHTLNFSSKSTSKTKIKLNPPLLHSNPSVTEKYVISIKKGHRVFFKGGCGVVLFFIYYKTSRCWEGEWVEVILIGVKRAKQVLGFGGIFVGVVLKEVLVFGKNVI